MRIRYILKKVRYIRLYIIECEDDLDYYNVENEQNDIYLMFAEKCTEYIYAALDRFFKTPTELRNEKLKKLDCL